MQKISVLALFLISFALVILSGCMNPTTIPGTGTVTDTPQITSTLSTVEVMTATGTCQDPNDAYIEGTIKNTDSEPVEAVVVGSTYDTEGTIIGSEYDIVTIEPNGTGSFRIIVVNGCGHGKWTYAISIEEGV